MPISAQEIHVRYNQAVALAADGRAAEAEAAYRELLARAPGTWAAWYNLGVLLQARGALPQAAEAYRSTLRHNAKLAEAHNNLGNVLDALGRRAEAEQCFRRALQWNPSLVQAAYNLGAAQQAAGRFEGAIAAFRQTLARDPHNASAWDGVWRCQLALGASAEAAATFLRWQAAVPASPELVLAGLHSARALGDGSLEERYLDLALRWPFPDAPAAKYSPVLGLLQYFDLPLEALRAAYARFDALAARESAAVPHPPRTPVRSPGARLRIGYVSGDFRSHVMGRLMWEVLSRHDRARFECLLFSLVAPRADDVLTQRFIGLADGFIDLSQLDDAAAARLIAERQIDVLVDLGGHTMSARPRIYFHRPARRLVTHLGYHGALGLSHCDGKISDAIADPPGTEAWQLEPPLRLDACLFPLVPAERAGAVLEAPAGLDGAFVFAAFVNILKLSPRCLAAWRAVLERVPRAKLLFSPFARGDRELLERVCAKAGIAAARLAFLDLPPGDARLASRYRLVHAALDTFPYGGGDTTLAALSNGVPVVTLAGRRHAERIGASLLTHAGVPELIAADEAQFADLGARLADDPAWRRGIGARLEAAFAHADAHLARHVRELERVFRELAQ